MDWITRLSELLSDHPLPSACPASSALEALTDGDAADAAYRIATLDPCLRLAATLVLEVAAIGEGVAPEALVPLGQRLTTDLTRDQLRLSELRRVDVERWAREAGIHLDPSAIQARDGLVWGVPFSVAVARAALEAGRRELALAVATGIDRYYVRQVAEIWAEIGLASTGTERDEALARAAEAGNRQPWIQDGYEETDAHAIALGHFAAGGLPPDHPSVRRVVSSLLQLGQTRARKDARSYAIVEAANHAARHYVQTGDTAWLEIAETLRDRVFTDELKDRVDAVLGGNASPPPPEQERVPLHPEVWEASAKGDHREALRRIDALAPVPEPGFEWVPQIRQHGDIIEPEAPPHPPESMLDLGGLKVALRGASTPDLPGIGLRIPPGDEPMTAAFVKACGLKKHRKKRGDLQHVVKALCVVGAVDAAIDAAAELTSPVLHGYELKDAIRPLAADLACHADRWTSGRRGRVLAMLEAPDPSHMAHVLLDWVEADTAADPERVSALTQIIHRRFAVRGDQLAGELALAAGLSRAGHPTGRERMASLLAQPPTHLRLIHRRRLFVWVLRRCAAWDTADWALTVALRLCLPNGQAYDQNVGLADLQRSIRDVWESGRSGPVIALLGSTLPVEVHRDTRRMVWLDAGDAPDELATLWAAWPHADDGPNEVAFFARAVADALERAGSPLAEGVRDLLRR
jgi:hypothetical protein